MAADLTTIFGSEIKVVAQPREAQRSLAGFPGAHGLVSMYLGTRGRSIVVTGILRAAGANYNEARANLQDAIDALEAYQWAYATDYEFKGTTYEQVVFGRLQLLPGAGAKVFHLNAAGEVFARFTCQLRSLL